MKYFTQILISQEIFLKIFDGLRNIFLCSPSSILIFKLMGSEHKNVQTGHQVDKIKTCHIKNHIHAEGIRQMVVKSKKDFFFYAF